MTNFTCSLSPAIKIATAVVVIALMSGPIAMVAVALWIAPGMASPWLLLAAGSMVLTLVGTWVFAPLGYQVTGDGVIVRRPMGALRIPAANLASVERVPSSAIGLGIRLCASGGLFGVFGLFWSKGLGRFWMWGTRGDHLVLLRLRTGLPVLLTPDDDEGLTKAAVALVR